MDKGHRLYIKNKNISEWTLRNNPIIFSCTKCKKYNSILTNNIFTNCVYCGNPNYIKK